MLLIISLKNYRQCQTKMMMYVVDVPLYAIELSRIWQIKKSFGVLSISLFLVCLGCCGDLKGGLELAEETPTLVRRSNNQLEKFLLRRAQKMLDDQLPNQQYCLLLAYELLYLWNALGACLKHSHSAIQIGKFHLFLNYIRNNL